ncbi:MAG: glycosyltransferase [Nitrococcus mobilis]|nr:glycosyltransferase [Nitrococcus mobilis]
MNNSTETIEISDPNALPDKPLVSVYTLAYNHEKFIADAIEGVIAQQCDFPIELIIGEDCSLDRTRNIVLDYQRRYPHLIRILTAEQNVGAKTNAARCQIAARGEFVAICEGDDYWHHPRKLQMQVELMSAHPQMTFCHTDFDRRTRFRTWHSKHKNYPTPYLARGNAYKVLLYEWTVMTATSMLRRDIFERFRGTEFDNPSWPFGDGNRLLFASTKGTSGYIDISTSTYRKVRNSAVNKDNVAHLRMLLATEECIELFMARHPVEAEDQRQIRAKLKKRIYRATFFAERIDLMNSTRQWLRANGFELNAMLHGVRIAIVKLKLPIRILRSAKNFVDLHLSAIPS